MIINITQHCTLRCPHCMQNAGPERNEFMNRETFTKALDFAFKIGSRVVSISGGEPTSHPAILDFIDEALDAYGGHFAVTVLSNGTFICDHTFVEMLAERMKNERLHMQISTFRGLYANFDQLHKPNLKAMRLLGPRCILCDKDSDIQMKPLGRAAQGEWYEAAKKANGFPSCINPCLAAAQIPDFAYQPGKVLESIFRFCIPIVSYNGSIRMGESEQCKVVANIADPHPEILKAMASFRPCGGCASYRWHLANPTTDKEKHVYETLYGVKK